MRNSSPGTFKIAFMSLLQQPELRPGWRATAVLPLPQQSLRVASVACSSACASSAGTLAGAHQGVIFAPIAETHNENVVSHRMAISSHTGEPSAALLPIAQAGLADSVSVGNTGLASDDEWALELCRGLYSCDSDKGTGP